MAFKEYLLLFIVVAISSAGCSGICADVPVRYEMGTCPLSLLVQKADVICVGTTTAVRATGTVRIIVGQNQDGSTALVNASVKSATFLVETVLKGSETERTLHVDFYSYGLPAVPTIDGPVYAELIPKQRVLVFLKHKSTGEGYILAQPFSSPSLNIVLSSGFGAADVQTGYPLRTVMLGVARSLAIDDKSKQSQDLFLLIGVGNLLYPVTRGLTGRQEAENIAQLRNDVSEPPSSDLEGFVRGQIIPLVTPLINSSDPNIHKLALYTAAVLQDVTVIPMLAAEAKPDQGGLDIGIGGYRTPDAVQPLLALLDNRSVLVKEQAALALANIHDPASIPAMTSHLNDTSGRVQNFLLYALSQSASIPPAITKPELKVKYWQDYVAKHKAATVPLPS